LPRWLSLGRAKGPANSSRPGRVTDVVKAYWDFARGYYAGESGRAELDSVKLALALLRRTYGEEPPGRSAPLALQVVRDAMVEAGWQPRGTSTPKSA